MDKIGDFQVGEVLHRGLHTLVCRATSPDGSSVILKSLRSDWSTPGEISNLKREYELVASLPIEGIVQVLRFEQFPSGPVMVLEDFGGESLAKQNSRYESGLDLLQSLALVVQLASIVGELHQRKVIHGNINPSNIIWNQLTGQLKLTDFSLASEVPSLVPSSTTASEIKGSLAYIAPEQTGKLSLPIDHRADLYSLGVTLFEQFTGRLPFTSEDSLELIHSHVARLPTPPHDLAPGVPVAVSSIILKLLEKNPEDRYQSAYGLIADLKQCQLQLRESRKILPFPLGRDDPSSSLWIPTKLYGRKQEVERLLQAFARVYAGAKETVLVAGYSGIGKTTLVQSAHDQIPHHKGHFITGKCDQYDLDVPYAALIGAFQALVGQILVKTSDEITLWSTTIRRALGDSGRLVADVLPEIESIIGAQPPVPELSPAESSSRFEFAFIAFVEALASPENPLVIFLDDLQWIDTPSLTLLELLLSASEIENLLLIGAYRENEVAASHPLALTRERLIENDCVVSSIKLGPLDEAEQASFVADVVQHDADSAQALSSLCLLKTRGNPFFMIQFLEAIHHDNLLTFDQDQGRWTWDIEGIEATGYTENVVELMTQRVQLLHARSLRTLEVAAAIGTRFASHLLANYLETTQEEIAEDLQIPRQKGYISKVEGDGPIYEFAHDRIQQAVYRLIDAGHRPEIHLRLGRLLAQGIPASREAAQNFDAVGHFNKCLDLLTDPQECADIAGLYLLAGNRAVTVMAPSTASRCYRAGLTLLGDDPWKQNYSLTLDLDCGLIEATYLQGCYEEAEGICEGALKYAQTDLDRARVYSLLCYDYTLQNRMEETLQTGLVALELLDVSLVNNPPLNHDIEFYRSLGEMTEPRLLAAMGLLVRITSCALVTQSNLLAPLVYTMLDLTIGHGTCSKSAFAYVWYACRLCWTGKEIRLGYDLGRLATEVVDQSNTRDCFTTVHHQFNSFIRHWCEHEQRSIDAFPAVIKSGKETGDIEYGTYVAVNYVTNLLLVGLPLAGIQAKQRASLDWVASTKFTFSMMYGSIFAQATQCLSGEAVSDRLLIGDFLNEKTAISEMEETRNNLNLFAVFSAKTMLSFFCGDYQDATQFAQKAELYEDAIGGLLPVTLVPFYGSLAAFRESHGCADQPPLRVEGDIKKLTLWAEHGPMNFQHKLDLVCAEYERHRGHPLEAEELYERAIKGAQDNGYLQEEALAFELAARFYLDRGMWRIAQTYLREALRRYARWGCRIRVARIMEEELLATLCRNTDNDTGVTDKNLAASTTRLSLEVLDAMSLRKATRSLSAEVILPDLLKTLLHIMLENSGAERGCLVLKRDKELHIEVEGSASAKEQSWQEPLPLNQASTELQPVSIIRYVANTLQILSLEDACSQGNFTKDPYVIRNRARSILCSPMLHMGELVGVVFLENRLTARVFSPDRLQVVTILSQQAGVAVQNARAFATLEERVQERTSTLKAAISALEESEARTRTLVENAPQAIVIIDREKGCFVEANRNAEELFKISRAKLLTVGPTEVSPREQPNQQLSSEYGAQMLELAAQGKRPVFDWVYRNSIGEEFTCEVRFVRFPSSDRDLIQGSISDMTERKRHEEERLSLERQVLHAQKLESLGVLAGGIAHDFNNLIMAILGNSDLALYELPPMSPARANILEIEKASRRAADLAKQMLAFSGRGRFVIEPLECNELIEEMGHLLDVSISKKAVLKYYFGKNLPTFDGDATQVRQIIMNLIINASEAIGNESGVISLSTGAIECDQAYLASANDVMGATMAESIPAGMFTYFEIADSGCGMNSETIESIFDPFFTTKFTGRGLGMSAVLGIVRGHKGAIKIYSEIGKGTTFKVLFPANKAEENSLPDSSIKAEKLAEWRGSGTVLIADDEEAVLAVGRQMLERFGFSVIAVSDGRQAVKAFGENSARIACVLLDLAMPHLDGEQAFSKMRLIQPDVKVILCSGYNEHDATQRFIGKGLAGFIQKPFTMSILREAMMKVLGSKE